jgi:hypothetical protein
VDNFKSIVCSPNYCGRRGPRARRDRPIPNARLKAAIPMALEAEAARRSRPRSA